MSEDLITLLKSKTHKSNPHFYSIMPINNVPSVITNGIMSFNKVKKLSHKSIALAPVQERRDSVIIPNGGKLHDYANLYFTYHNPMMYRRSNIAESLCVLAVKPSVLHISGCVLSDQNASTDFARFYPPKEGIESINFDLVFQKYWTNNPDPYIARREKAIKCAEILVPDCIPYDYIVGAYVLNEDSEKELLETGFDKPIKVNPSVFYR